MNKTRLKIGLFGIGAIGSVIGAILRQNELLVITYFNRSPRNSLRVKFGSIKETIPINTEPSKSEKSNLDWLIIAIKEYHYLEAKQTLKTLISPQTKVVIIRNGLDLHKSVNGLTTRDKILECLIDCPTQKDDEGYYVQITKGKIIVRDNLLSKQFAELFTSDDRLEIEQVSDFKTLSWKKLIESSSLGALLILSGQTCWIFENEEMIELYEKLVVECIEVAIKDGAKIDLNYKDDLIIKLKNYPPNKGSSMLTDRLNNRRIELMAKNGIIDELAKQYGIETPLNNLICKLLKCINLKYN